jgi:hypothetical protein
MATTKKKTTLPDPLEPGNIPGQKPATPERMPGHTRELEKKARDREQQKRDAGEAEEALDDALEQTFPASDPIAAESTLVTGRRR